MRGEETVKSIKPHWDLETPPRAWGREREIIGYFPIDHTKSIPKTHKQGKMQAKMEKMSNFYKLIEKFINYLNML